MQKQFIVWLLLFILGVILLLTGVGFFVWSIDNSTLNTSDINNTTPAKNTDDDGLSDKEEAAYRTSLQYKDMDGDGLTDSEEVLVYKTNPQKADTDGDGYNNGEEVQNGYDPLEKAP